MILHVLLGKTFLSLLLANRSPSPSSVEVSSSGDFTESTLTESSFIESSLNSSEGAFVQTRVAKTHEAFSHSHKVRRRTSEWKLTDKDKGIMGQINGMLAGPGLDIEWSWQDGVYSREWFFGLVKLTDTSEVEALANHMIHRHGLGPLMMAKFRPDAMDHPDIDDSKAGFARFWQELKKAESILKMKALLTQLSLDGIRHLHSFDHEWSVIQGEVRKVPNCNRFSPVPCILQAGYSAQVHDFMLKHPNFKNPDAVSQTLEDSEEIQELIYNTHDALDADFEGQFRLAFRENFMKPEHTSSNEIGGELDENEDFRLPRVYTHRHKIYMEGIYYWQAGGISKVKIQLTEEQRDAIWGNTTGYTNVMGHIFRQWLHDRTGTYKRWFSENGASYWMGELAEFFNMCEVAKKLRRKQPIGHSASSDVRSAMWASEGNAD